MIPNHVIDPPRRTSFEQITDSMVEGDREALVNHLEEAMYWDDENCINWARACLNYLDFLVELQEDRE